MEVTRNTPRPITPRNRIESKVEGLRDFEPPPPTYKLFHREPNGQELFVGEFPTPVIMWGMKSRNEKDINHD